MPDRPFPESSRIPRTRGASKSARQSEVARRLSLPGRIFRNTLVTRPRSTNETRPFSYYSSVPCAFPGVEMKLNKLLDKR